MSDTYFNPIDLAQLPAPKVVESLDFEQIYNERKAALIALYPEEQQEEIAEALSRESNPLSKLLQENSYRELVLRHRINVAAQAVMITHATGTDLDNLVAKEPYNIQRLVINEGDPNANPPIPPSYESDGELRRRAQLAPRRYSTAGPTDSYRFWALSAHSDVADASVTSPNPCEVLVTVLSRTGNGVPSQEVINAVNSVLNDDEIRPLTDLVTVQAATAVNYSLDAELTLYYGAGSEAVLQEANARLDKFLTDTHKLGLDITLAGLTAALFAPGVQNVKINAPLADVVIAEGEISYLNSRQVIISGRDE